MLYNKYKGILRVAIYRSVNITSSYQSLTLSFTNNQTNPSIMALADNDINKSFKNQYNPNLTQQVIVKGVGFGEWICADFNLSSYDNAIINPSGLTLSISEVDDATLTASGDITLDGVLTPRATEDSGSGVLNFLSKAGSLSSIVTKNKDGAMSFINNSTLDLADKLSFNSFIKGASTTLDALKFVGDVVKLFVGDKGGTAITTTFDLNLKGKINITGNITKKAPVDNIAISLAPNSSQTAYNPVQTIPWGVLSMNSPINVQIYSIQADSRFNTYRYTDKLTVDVAEGFTVPSPNLNPLVVNSNIGGMTLESVEYGFVPELGDDAGYQFEMNNATNFLNREWYVGWTRSFEYGPNPSDRIYQNYPVALGIAYTFNINQDPSKPVKNIGGGKIVIYKQFGTNIINGGSRRVGISEEMENEGRVPFPNPTTNDFNIPINNKAGDNYEVNINSITGKRVWNRSGVANSSNLTLNCNDESLLSGTYLVETIVNGKKEVHKIQIIK
jgi:hypothetical protein